MPLSSTERQAFKVRPLATRLLLSVLAFSLLLALAITAIHLWRDYGHQADEIRASQSRIASLVSSTLAGRLKARDYEAISAQLNELLEFRAIQNAEVQTSMGERFIAGKPVAGENIRQAFELPTVDPVDDRSKATLVLTSSLALAQQRLLRNATGTFLAQALIVLASTMGLLLLVRFYLSRHLEAIADFAAHLNLNVLSKPLKLNRKEPSQPDELRAVVDALNEMRERMVSDAHSLKQSHVQSRDERDEAIRANQAKNLFLANISRELRIPLQSVLGYASLLNETNLDNEQREFVQTLMTAGEGLSAIMNDLLDISSVETGRLVLEQVPFDLRETLNEVLYMLEPRALEKRLALETRVDEDLPEALRGDPLRLRQVLVNLTSNAIKFTHSGHVLLSVEVLSQQEGKVRLRVAVEDTGQGIADADLSAVFEPYVQLHNKTTHPVIGAGLGLTLCRQLLGMMKASFDVHSQPGKGSTFWFELDLPVEPGRRHHFRGDTKLIAASRLLVVDSYELSRKITLELLSRYEPADCSAVRTAGEAIAEMNQTAENGTPYDVLLMDGFLPDMDSNLLCRQLRGSPTLSRCRILVLSANPHRGDGEHFRQAGADAFLSKSLRDSRLIPMLCQLLNDLEHGERRFLTRFSLSEETASPAVRKITSGTFKILLVEDNPVNRALTCRLLEKLGATVVTANDGEAACRYWANQSFDIIFMDCIMPRMDGYEATRRLRHFEQDGDHPRTPVIALTASAMEEDEEECLAAGMDAFVAKPVTLEILRSVIEQVRSHNPTEPAS